MLLSKIWIHIASSSEKVNPLLSSTHLAHWSVHISLLIQMRQLFYWEKVALWIEDYFSQKQFEVKNVLMFDLFLTNMQLLSHVDYLWIIVMFLSAVWALILTAPIHCCGALVSKWFTVCCSISLNLFWWRNKLIYILGGLSLSTLSSNLKLFLKDKKHECFITYIILHASMCDIPCNIFWLAKEEKSH